jgi:hypothetical protein
MVEVRAIGRKFAGSEVGPSLWMRVNLPMHHARGRGYMIEKKDSRVKRGQKQVGAREVLQMVV